MAWRARFRRWSGWRKGRTSWWCRADNRPDDATFDFTVNDPLTWTLEAPNLYLARVVAGADDQFTRFGVAASSCEASTRMTIIGTGAPPSPAARAPGRREKRFLAGRPHGWNAKGIVDAPPKFAYYPLQEIYRR